MNRIQVLLEPETLHAVKKMARGKNTSASAYIRKIIKKEVTKEKKLKNTADILLRAAKNATKGGPKDLSTNDDYLYGDL